MKIRFATLLNCALLVSTFVLEGCSAGGKNGPSIPPNVSPDAVFSVSPDNGKAPLVAVFDAGASSDSDGSIVSFNWDFGDGGTGEGAEVQHDYLEDGNYTATLTIEDDDGATASTSAEIVVDSTISLKGTIRVLASSSVDGDVNDPAAERIENDSLETAQQLANPVTLGGYVNLPGRGSTGALEEDGDPRDVYSITLTGNDTILLAIAESGSDIDLFLYDADGVLVDGSVSPGNQTESLRVRQSGDFFLEVLPMRGASNYVLTVGQDQLLSSRSLTLNKDFVAGEILLTVEQTAPEPSIPGLRLRRRGARGLRLMGLENPELALTALQRRGARQAAVGRHVPPRLQRRLDTLLTVKALSEQAGIKRAEPNLIRFASRVPNDTFYGNQWHYPNINLPQAWDVTTGDESVIVAVIDTGVLVDHPDFEGRLENGYDFISDPSRAGDGDGRDPDPNDPGDAQPGLPSSFHGTHVSGTVAAASDNGIGVAGVAWRSRVMPLRVLGIGGGTSFDLIQAILYAAGEPNASGDFPEQAADIINMSLGGEFFSQSEQDAILSARNQGLIVVAAAGNAGSTEPSYPAAYEGVISVSASTISKTLAFYSNLGPTVDIAAPGGSNQTDVNGDGFGDGVASTLADDSDGNLQFGYGILMGTSMAAPHVAGVAALMKALHPQLTPAQFDQALATGLLTDDLGNPGRDDSFGDGLINAHKAVTTALGLASGNTDFPPLASVTPSTLNFGAFENEIGFDLVSVGGEGLQIGEMSVDQDWLTLTPISVNADRVGRYQAAIRRDELVDGIYTASAIIETNANRLELNVIMQVSSLDLDSNAGYHYILLIDANTDRIVDQVDMPAADGEYRYQFNDLVPGRYQIIAGSDSDNDFLICDNGESCGSYQTLDSPQILQVDDKLDGLDFVTGFLVNFADLDARAAATDKQNPPVLHLQGQWRRLGGF